MLDNFDKEEDSDNDDNEEEVEADDEEDEEDEEEDEKVTSFTTTYQITLTAADRNYSAIFIHLHVRSRHCRHQLTYRYCSAY